MTIIAVPVNFQEDFNTLPYPPIIINDLPNATETERRVLMNTISTTFEDDLISVAPTCDCGSTRGVPVGTRCHSCGTEVKSRFNEDVSASLWFRRPGGVEKLFHPYFWFQLKKRFTKSGFSLIQYLTDPAYTARVKTPAIVDQLNNEGFKRDYNYFIQNFWVIMDFLFSKREFSKVKKGQEDPLFTLLKNNKHLLLSDYIPLPNKVFIITETSNMGVFIDPVTTKAKDVLLSIASIDRDFYEQDERVKRNRTARALDNLASFYPEYTYKNLAQKPGQIRKHWFGSRSNFSFRYVITSIEGPHRYDEIHVPWAVGLTTFRPHLLNKLKKMGYRLNDAIGLLYRCVHKYDPLIERLLNELIQEAGHSGIPVQMQRNPSLLQGSMLLVYITRFKTDLRDNSVSISNYNVKSMNADYDGDQLNFSLPLDFYLAEKWKTIETHHNVYLLSNEPFQISGNVAIPKPNVAQIAMLLDQHQHLLQ